MVVGKHFTFLLIVVKWEIPTPFQRQPRLVGGFPPEKTCLAHGKSDAGQFCGAEV